MVRVLTRFQQLRAYLPEKYAGLKWHQATNLLVELYTNDQLPVRLLRGAGLRVAQGLLPLKKGIARHLTARA